MHATRPKGGLGIHWNVAYWPRGNLQVCIFARGEFVFPLRRPISVALLLLSRVFERANILLNFRGLNVPCFYMSEKKENLKFALILLLYLISIQHAQ